MSVSRPAGDRSSTWARARAPVANPSGAATPPPREGIRGLSKVAALEWGRDNIRVNVICPFAESDGVKFWKSGSRPREYDKAVGRVPMKRIGDVRTDVGALVAFLLGFRRDVHHRADHSRRRRNRLFPLVKIGGW